jgi:Flp pilus assembly secretin CpaC
MVCVKTWSRGLVAVLALAALAPVSNAWALDKTISVVIDHAHLVNLPPGTTTLIIGNPTIADVTMVGPKSTLMVLTPKAFGETNFIALDAKGDPLSESLIRVVAGTDTLVVQRGMDRQSYACAPKCQATEKLGDDSKFFSATVDQAKSYNTSAATVTPPVSGQVLGTH